MTYISQKRLPLTNPLEIVDDIFQVNLSLDTHSVSLSEDFGIFDPTIQKDKLTTENLLSVLYDFIERNNNYWDNNITLLPTVKSIDKINEQEVKITFTIEFIRNDKKQEEVLTYSKIIKIEE